MENDIKHQLHGFSTAEQLSLSLSTEHLGQ